MQYLIMKSFCAQKTSETRVLVNTVDLVIYPKPLRTKLSLKQPLNLIG